MKVVSPTKKKKNMYVVDLKEKGFQRMEKIDRK